MSFQHELNDQPRFFTDMFSLPYLLGSYSPKLYFQEVKILETRNVIGVNPENIYLFKIINKSTG